MSAEHTSFHHLNDDGCIDNAMPVTLSVKAFRWLDQHGYKTLSEVPGHLISMSKKTVFGAHDDDVIVGDCFAVIPAGSSLQVTLPSGQTLNLSNDGARIVSTAKAHRPSM